MQHTTPYQQPRSPMHWQNDRPVHGSQGARHQSGYGTYISTPRASQSAYSSQMPYLAPHSQGQYEGTTSNGPYPPFHNLPQGASFSSQPSYPHGAEYYNSQEMHRSVNESVQHRMGTQCRPGEGADGHGSAGGGPHLVHGRYDSPRDILRSRDTSGGRGDSLSADRGQQHARPTPSSLGRRASHSTSTTHTSPGVGTLHEPQENLRVQKRGVHTNNSPNHISTDSSKSSPPYTLSQRKQHRVEEASYLKEVKRSIAEGRVPQVRLQQNNSGDIVQYKSQFLNALKLAALSLVPHADIDVKNASTMEEIMKEVKRQFIIEAPLPTGMVAGFLQRLYKRNRSVYHRHWTIHGDHSKPDDCPSAAWLQLVDYWKSREGSAECERNKANASARKGAAVRYPALTDLCENASLHVLMFQIERL